MPILNGLIWALAWLGRQGTRALAVSVFLGLALPTIAAAVKPYLGEMVFLLLLFSYLRTDPTAFRRYLAAPGIVIAAALWVMVALPAVFGLIFAWTGLRAAMPALYTIIILHMAAAPITSSAAFAALIGLDVALSLITLIATSALSPITSGTFSYLFLGVSLISPVALGLKLFFFFAASGATAWVIRRVAGQAWIERQKDPIDGLNVLAVALFAIAAMDGVPRYATAHPLLTVELLVFITVLAALMVGLSVLAFWRVGVYRGLAIGLLAAFRNLGVVMAALGSSLPEIAWFYFALVQFPIFLLPALIKPLAAHFQHKTAD